MNFHALSRPRANVEIAVNLRDFLTSTEERRADPGESEEHFSVIHVEAMPFKLNGTW